jgi:hypothetical protein
MCSRPKNKPCRMRQYTSAATRDDLNCAPVATLVPNTGDKHDGPWAPGTAKGTRTVHDATPP